MIRCRMTIGLTLLIFSLFVIGEGRLPAETHWPQWRGPLRDGHSNETELPVRWDAKSVKWKTPLKGTGQSSPTIWGNRMFLTTALENGKQRVVFGVDVNDGRIVWEHVAWTGEPEPSHKMNGWASASCATDGEVVAAFFGKGGLHVYSVDGQHLWSQDLGPFESPWGTAACPVIVGDLLIQNGDSDKNAFIIAFDKRTGRTVWRKARPDHRGWSTPVLIQRGGREELLLNGHTGVTAYDPTSGQELWFTPNANGRGEPTVTVGAGMMYVVCGLSGDMYGARLGDGPNVPEKIWSAPRRGGRDLPSPIVVGDYVFVSAMSGLATCYEAATGKQLWLERLGGQFCSSPIAAKGLIYHQNETGETVVIKLGPTLEIVSRNSLDGAADELFRASLTPLGGRIYSRSNKFLYCVGTDQKLTAIPFRQRHVTPATAGLVLPGSAGGDPKSSFHFSVVCRALLQAVEHRLGAQVNGAADGSWAGQNSFRQSVLSEQLE